MSFPFKVNGTDMPCPSKFAWGLQDISAPDSGRTLDGKMWKNRVGQKVKIDLEWAAVSCEDCATILQAFNSEYFNVTYHDPKENANVTKEFYRGDASAPYYWWVPNQRFNFQTISFSIIER